MHNYVQDIPISLFFQEFSPFELISFAFIEYRCTTDKEAVNATSMLNKILILTFPGILSPLNFTDSYY